MLRRAFLILAVTTVCCSAGCSDARILGKEGRIYLVIPFGQGSQDMEARKYIPLKFGLVKEGMTKKDVLDRFGEPHHRAVYKGRYTVWYYKSATGAGTELLRDIYIFFDDYKVISPPDPPDFIRAG